MLYLTYSLDIIILFAVHIVLGVMLNKRYELEGRWWWIGATVYIISQVTLLPIQNYILNPFLNRLSYSGEFPSVGVLIMGGLILGLSIGVFEELLRYGMFRWWTKDARSYESSLLLGTGAGGAASIILGFLVIYNFVNMMMVRNMDLSTLVPADQIQMLQSQITAFWSAPWFYTLREALGQLFMLVIQISLAVMVLQVFIGKKNYWILLAIGYHTVVEAARVITLNLSSEYATNAVLGGFAIVSLLIILSLRRQKTLAGSAESSVDKRQSQDGIR